MCNMFRKWKFFESIIWCMFFTRGMATASLCTSREGTFEDVVRGRINVVKFTFFNMGFENSRKKAKLLKALPVVR